MVFAKTKSVCPVCLKVIPAEKDADRDGNIYMLKSCPEHGSFKTLIWEGDVRSYLNWQIENRSIEAPVDGKEPSNGCPYDCGLCKEHLRKGCCMLLELTTRCNLRCPVCFASAGEKESNDLSLEEIEKQYDYLMSHGGPFNIQLSGGEPTMRDDLPEIISLGLKKGFTFFQLNTNGIRLAEEPGYALKLKDAGLSCAFLQFDSLSDDAYLVLRGRKLRDLKLKAIENCREAGLGVVLVPVIAPGVNDNEIGDILKFAVSNIPYVRGVHFQPVSYFGRNSLDRSLKRITIPLMLRLIEEQTGGIMKKADFAGGEAENPYCSFHASYLRRKDGSLKSLPRAGGNSSCCCCNTASDDTRNFVATQWGSLSAPATQDTYRSADNGLTETSSLDAFLEYALKNTFTVSGMIFQDAYNLDLQRLKRCYICEMDRDLGMVPFCAYNLTDSDGKYLYRK